MARVVAFVPDLLFGSNVLGALREAGHGAELCSSAHDARRQADGADVLVVDLTADAQERVGVIDGLPDVRTLAFYSHVEADTRALALDAGFDLVVPRSRMAREGGALVTRLAGEESP